jgi:hypothetical protein
MKELELREHVTCLVCGKRIGASGLPMFWIVRIERHGVKLDAIQRQDHLAGFLGGHAGLARVMGPDEEMTTPLMDPAELTVCETCGTRSVCVAVLAEYAIHEREAREKAEGAGDAS